jgi:hypothetical protein
VLPQLHMLIACDLAAPTFGCEATVLVGESLQQFYVSHTAVYAWTRDWSTQDDLPSMLYQIPFDGAAIRAVQVTGWPLNQLAFHESQDGYLNVLVAQERGQTLLRLPLESLSDGSEAARPSGYRALTGPEELLSAVRFVDRYLLFATSRVEVGQMAGHTIHAAEWAGDRIVRMPVPHNTGQIEPMGTGAVAIGPTANDFHVTSVALAGDPSVVGASFARARCRDRRGATASSTGLKAPTLASSACHCHSRTDWDGPARAPVRRPSCSFASSRCRCSRSGTSSRRRASKRTGAAPRASTGMATHGRCSSLIACWRCWATKSSKGASGTGRSRNTAASTSLRCRRSRAGKGEEGDAYC